jgi:alpha-amylase/alpha-mannosidase (GH57 family)
MSEKDYFLTIHGHFYQPPRENPWLEAIELQDSAAPFHNWNERVAFECYVPNSGSRIVDHRNNILDIVNNYSLISFNFGATLLSWLELHAPGTYERIIEADRQSAEKHSGHGNALAQVYNHVIMPLANERDKYSQVIWGIRDFQYRFGRKPEGMWLSETAVDDDTLRVLVDCGIVYTVLSPYQASKVKPLIENDNSWIDVSWGNIDPGQAYRYYLKDNTDRYIDLFFYDGSISKSVAFENLLQSGEKFINRLKDGIAVSREYNQLVHIATDGESYGHHTKFGDMALSYIMKKKAVESGFNLTNYGEYLAKNPPKYRVDIKETSSWSCVHGVGRWKEDCGCSTGAQACWNQKWRKPLRESLDWLRDELAIIYEQHADKYLKDPWKTRNKYIDLILDKNNLSIEHFCAHEGVKKLSSQERVNIIKLLEMQRHAMLMYTSCGWFFADISGIETTQILKYAARAMQIAEDFSDINLEDRFLEKLSEANSNIKAYGSGKDVYLKFVKPSIVSIKQVVSHWAISSLFEEYSEETEVYCYKIKSLDYRKIKKSGTALVLGRIEIVSNVTQEYYDMIFALLHFGGGDFHCVIRGFSGDEEYNQVKEDLVNKYHTLPLTEVIRSLDDHFGKEYFTLKDLFVDERRKIINILIKDQLEKFSQTYKSLYEEGKGPMLQLYELGLTVPPEFKIAAEYTLGHKFNDVILMTENIGDKDLLREAFDLRKEAKKLDIKIDCKNAEKIYSLHITRKIKDLAINIDVRQCQEIINVLSIAKELDLKPGLSDAQDFYFSSIYLKIPDFLELLKRSENLGYDKNFVATVLNLGERLSFNVEKFYNELNKLTSEIELTNKLV